MRVSTALRGKEILDGDAEQGAYAGADCQEVASGGRDVGGPANDRPGAAVAGAQRADVSPPGCPCWLVQLCHYR